MKKRLESELISIAHRILKLKNKSEVDQLYKETQKLYETLAVLKFYQDNFELVKNDVEPTVLEQKLEQHLEEETPQEVVFEVKPADEPVDEPTVEIQAEPEAIVATEEEAVVVTEEAIEEVEENIVSEETVEEAEPVLEEEAEEVIGESEPETVEEEPVFKPIFELADDEEEEDPSDSELAEHIEPAETASEVKPDTKHVALEDLLGENYVDPIFVKPNEVSLFASEAKEENTSKPASLNTASSKTIEIGLNDRVAFVNNLFGESNEDFNRVISQLNTFDTLEEAKTFLNEMVIPDYNYWVGKEDYIERFMTVVENKFK
ncbi:hypothetical protein IVB69_07220 [Flavobacterium sp. J49]|uniref:hypothetical protein n=1 Tax=Flavobacterium sp. J49 TaxID=2718534 RepID=UPI001593E25A|nr:hypothetical protein [Flavobacterium sp. J49]MBF6641265.1 hypothetical protein [Flavobacterium sp. J49]NIC02512.1 hypothetical protein [Flavobacterium sp. J49]